MPLSNGDKLGPYEILARIGAGGMGEVYRARDAKLGRQVAIKVLPAHLAADASARERLRREASAAAALDHPFICKVFEIGEAGEELFLVMELIAGETLHQRLAAGPLPLAEALRIAAELAEALEEAHRNSFVHRDLKPANVMIAQGHVKVMDFGMAKQFSPATPKTPAGADTPTLTSASPLTEFGATAGTPGYMSPEQVRGEVLDQRSDLFSFGILLCQLLGNAHPFHRPSTQETMAAILRDAPDLSTNLPQGLMLLIRRLLAKDLDVRYQSMAEVRADLALVSTATLTPGVTPQQPRIPLIGREAERNELLGRLEAAMAGRGSMVMIGGEPGVGKTHLIDSILEEARRRGAYANIGHCYEMEGSPPYVPFIEMLERTSQTAPKANWRNALGESASEIARLMPELRRMYSDIPPAIELPPEQQRRYLFNAYREYIERAAQGTPIVLVFEDLHWADEPTLLLLQHLAQILSVTPLLLIGTYRDVDLEVSRPFAKTLEAMVRQKQASRMSLRRLGVDGVEAMLASMSGQTPPPSLARVVFAETEGNPFFVEEIFRHLEEEGKLFDETGKWRPGLRADQLQVPEGVRLVLGRRLDRLGADARRILTTGAVIGRSFSLRLLEALENSHPDAALDAVEEAERAHLVAAEPLAGREARYRFVHELVRQTLAGSLSLPRRQRLHARVAEAIERVYAANLEAQASPLAHHLYQAGAAVDPEKASTYLEMAAMKARTGAAHEEALAHIENALSLWEGEQGLRVAGLMLQKGEILRSLRRTDEAVSCLEASIAMFEEAGAAARMAQASLSLAGIQVWRLERAAVERTTARALESLGTAEPELQAMLRSLRVAAVLAMGDVAHAIREWEEFGSPDNAMAPAIDEFTMQYEQAAKSARKSAEAYREAGNLWFASEIEFRKGLVACCGRPEEGARHLADAMQLAQRVGNDNILFAIRVRLALCRSFRGNLREAGLELEKACAATELNQSPVVDLISDFHRGVSAGLRGNLSEAEHWFRHRAEQRTAFFGLKESSLFALWAEAGDSRAEEAWKERRWSLPVPGQPNPVGAWTALDRCVVGLASMGRKEEAAAMRPLTGELVQTGVWISLYSRFPVRTVAGIAAACAGDWAEAEAHHRMAIHQMDTAPYRLGQPMAREWYARMLLDRSEAGDVARAQEMLTEALAVYEELEVPLHATRTRARLDSLS